MQLSSALLSATALLAHAASGFLLRAETRQPGSPWSPIASVRGDTVGFYNNDQAERADIDLQGTMIVNGFGLEPQDPGLFMFKSARSGANVIPDPFLVIDGKFKWLGEENTKWLLCGQSPDSLDLYLARDGAAPSDMACIEADLKPLGG